MFNSKNPRILIGPKPSPKADHDGFYVIRTNLPGEVMEPDDVVGSYKSLALVERKNTRRRTDDGAAVTSWRDLLCHMGTLSLNTVARPINPNYAFTVIATDLQQKAFELPGVKPVRVL